MAEAFGNQPERVIEAARERAQRIDQDSPGVTAEFAVTFSKEKNLERDAVVEERELLRDALRRSMGDAAFDEIKAEFEKRVEAGNFIKVEGKTSSPGRAFTTQEMIDCERDTIRAMRQGQNKHVPLVSFSTLRDIETNHSPLSQSQRAAVAQILASRDRITALEGVAGAGKTTSLGAIREGVEREGYKVEGFAPSSRAAQKLAEAGIEAGTLQRHLTRPDDQHDGKKRPTFWTNRVLRARNR